MLLSHLLLLLTPSPHVYNPRHGFTEYFSSRLLEFSIKLRIAFCVGRLSKFRVYP